MGFPGVGQLTKLKRTLISIYNRHRTSAKWKTAKDIIQQLRWIGDKSTALFMLDQKMAERSAVAAAPVE